jgi:hypothetical protein
MEYDRLPNGTCKPSIVIRELVTVAHQADPIQSIACQPAYLYEVDCIYIYAVRLLSLTPGYRVETGFVQVRVRYAVSVPRRPVFTVKLRYRASITGYDIILRIVGIPLSASAVSRNAESRAKLRVDSTRTNHGLGVRSKSKYYSPKAGAHKVCDRVELRGLDDISRSR